MRGADHGGGQHQGVARRRRTQAGSCHQEHHPAGRDPGGQEEPRRQAALEQRGEQDREADQHAGVGGAGERHPVRLQREHRRLRAPEQEPDADLAPRRTPADHQRQHGGHRHQVAQREHHQHPTGHDQRLGGQIAAAPDHGHGEQQKIPCHTGSLLPTDTVDKTPTSESTM
ncbi:hypothetical protein Ade02nite_12830 [Paractinoplanes deccanensis]|uniref:Uncharacterized protein n=1 Tax=Paractinoplanes deccanensis TaxID=113561 RepID=A0ABQ3XY23_9ACTN|nr:hypothetical protein Ade02nite_12830 [Actinoplanes deccanensis]